MRSVWCAGMLVLGLAGGVVAGETSRHQDRRDLADMVDTYLLMQVQDRLELSDEQFAKAMPIIRQLQEHRWEGLEQRREGLRALRRLLESGKATDSTVGPGLARLREAATSMCQKVAGDMAALDALLTPVQQAKYRVLEAEVERRIRHIRRRAGDRGPRFPSPEGMDSAEGQPAQP